MKNNPVAVVACLAAVILVFGCAARQERVRISDGRTEFSFVMPQNWALETRHSGERELTVEEMRQYLSSGRPGGIKVADEIYPDYSDLPLSKLRTLPDEEVKRKFFRSKDEWLPYPNASISAGNYISYSDTAWEQIDFYIIRDFSKKKTWFNDIKSGFPGVLKKSEKIAGLFCEVIVFPVDRDEKGRETVTKNGTGGRIYYIPLNKGKDMLVINKQAKGGSGLEKGFKIILETFRIESGN
ncbi:MAG: hypothetical protein WC490_06920 [Candidatus Margulisiibacteriota bacterium]